MPTRTGKPPPSPLAVLSVVALLLAAVSGQSSSLECREDTRVTRTPNGVLVYGALPPTDAPDTEDYNPQGLGGWYDLARGFVNAVQPENLPYDVIEETIRENDLGCSVIRSRRDEECTSGDTDAQTTLQEFGEWWAPLIAVTVLGGVLAIVFGIVGAIFWCCRCCGQCGGGRSQRDPKDKYMFGVTIALFLVTLLLFVGVVLSFYSNEQSFDTIESLQTTMNDIVGTAVDYINAFLDDGDGILCLFIQVTDIALNETTVLNISLSELIDEVAVDVDNVLQRLNTLTAGINQTSDILMNVSATTQQLQSDGTDLSTTLGNIATNVGSLRSSCDGIPALSSQCANIPPSSVFQAGANYNNLPDVSQELTDVQDALDGINLDNSIEEGNAEFERISGEIQSQVNEHLGGLDDTSSNSSSVLGALIDANSTLFDTRDEVIGDVKRVIRNEYNPEDCPTLDEILAGDAEDTTVDVGFIRQCYINQFFERLQEYDEYRYAFGVIVCCLALTTVVLTLVGMILGVAGWRKDRSPDSRTRLSHCGGIVLLIDVGLTFFFAFVLLILASLAFFFGSNIQKICQAIEPPEYELYTRVVDNRELWGGSLLGEAVLGEGRNLSLSGALRACEADEALYTAFNLQSLFDVRDRILNTSEIFDDLQQQVNDTISSFNYTSDSFLDNSTQTALSDFTSASVDSINITEFRETLSGDTLGFNLTETITTLMQLRDAFNAAGETDLVTLTDSIIFDLESIRDTQLGAIEGNVELLERQVDQLSTHIDTVVVSPVA
jgi:prominin 1